MIITVLFLPNSINVLFFCRSLFFFRLLCANCVEFLSIKMNYWFNCILFNIKTRCLKYVYVLYRFFKWNNFTNKYQTTFCIYFDVFHILLLSCFISKILLNGNGSISYDELITSCSCCVWIAIGKAIWHSAIKLCGILYSFPNLNINRLVFSAVGKHNRTIIFQLTRSRTHARTLRCSFANWNT